MCAQGDYDNIDTVWYGILMGKSLMIHLVN